MYKTIFNKETKLTKSILKHKELTAEWTDKEPTGIKSVWNEELNDWEETASQSEIDLKQRDNALLLTLEVYQTYKFDGNAYYDLIQAKIALAVNTGNLIISIAFQLESIIKPYMDKVKSGDWATTNYLMQNLTDDNTIIQDWIDEIKLHINNYHSNNYKK